jgi:hypothetical protein
MDKNEKAETVLVIIKQIFVWGLKGIIGFCLLLSLIYVISQSYQWYTLTRHENKIHVLAKFDKKLCKFKQYPLFVEIKNNSSRTIEKAKIKIDVTRIGRSTKLNDYSDLESDKIIKPKESYGVCRRVESQAGYGDYLDGANMVATVKNVDIEFSETEIENQDEPSRINSFIFKKKIKDFSPEERKYIKENMNNLTEEENNHLLGISDE